MSTLDRYIARQYAINVVALLVLLFCFVVTIDVALNIDRFVSNAENMARAAAPGADGQKPEPSSLRTAVITVFLVVDLWWPRLLQLFNFMLGLVLAGAMGFTVTQLVRHRELVGMLAGGISLRRVARPIIVVAVLATGLQVLNQELVLPRIAPLLSRDPGDAGKREWSAFEVKLPEDGQGRLYFARHFDPERGEATNLHIWERDKEGRAVRRISADRAVWRDGAWRLENPREVPLDIAATASPQTSADAAAERPSSVTAIETDMDPTTLLVKRYAGFSQSLSWRQIGQMVHSPLTDEQMRDRLERVRWGRVSLMISNVLALVITLPFFLMREPRNMVLQSVKCAPVGIIAMMGAVLGSALTLPGLPPALGVFLPVMVLVPIAIAVVAYIKT